MRKDRLAIFIIIVIVAIVYSIQRKNEPETKEKPVTPKKEIKTLTPSEREGYELLVDNGFLKIEAYQNKAYIDPAYWNKLTVDEKRGFSYGLAIHCGNERGNHLYYVNIYDLYSGKKLAKYNSWGFDVY